MTSTLRRAWLLVNIAVTIALLPALFPDSGSGSGSARAASVRALAAPVAPVEALVGPTTTTSTSTSTSLAPLVDKVVTRVEQAATPSTTTTTRPRPTTTTTTTTTTTAPPPPPPAEPAPSGSESGRATWYDYKPGICAHKTLPFGTVVTVNAVNGKSVQCTVGDRGPYVDGYVIDLHYREFEQLAPRSTGRIDVTITW